MPENRDARWEDVEPHLDEAMAELSSADRDAVVLRFLERRPMREVGQRLGVSEETARQRVSRAVGRLRRALCQRLASQGVVVQSASLATILESSPIVPSPPGLVELAASAAGAGTSESAVVIAKGALKIMAASKAKSMVVTAVVVLGLGTLGTTATWVAMSGWRTGSREPVPVALASTNATGGGQISALDLPGVDAPAELQGEWAAEVDGKRLSLTFAGSVIRTKLKSEDSVARVIWVDENASPKAFDVVVLPGSDWKGGPSSAIGKTFEVAYEMMSDGRLRVAFADPEVPRAVKLEPGPGIKAHELRRVSRIAVNAPTELQGEWVSVERPDESIVFDGSRVVTRGGGQEVILEVVWVDEKAGPKAFDMVVVKGEEGVGSRAGDAGLRMEMVYDVAADGTMRLAVPRRGYERPKVLERSEGVKVSTYKWKRSLKEIQGK